MYAQSQSGSDTMVTSCAAINAMCSRAGVGRQPVFDSDEKPLPFSPPTDEPRRPRIIKACCIQKAYELQAEVIVMSPFAETTQKPHTVTFH